MSKPQLPFPPFPEPLATALGHLLVRFQALESELCIVIARFMKPGSNDLPDLLTVAVLGELPFRSLIKLLKTIPMAVMVNGRLLAEIAPEDSELMDALDSLLLAAKLANDAEERRNRLVHSSWLWLACPLPDDEAYRVRLRGGARQARAAFSIESAASVEAVTELIDSAHRELALASAGIHFFVRTALGLGSEE